MRCISLYFIACILLCSSASSGQSLPNSKQIYRHIDSLMNIRHIPHGWERSSGTRAGDNIHPVNFPQQQLRPKSPSGQATGNLQRTLSNSCADTSLRLTYRKDPLTFANDWITKTRDGNILIPGYEINDATNETAAHLIKCDQQGDTIWSRQIKGGYTNEFISVYKAFELNDNSILLAGDLFVPMPHNGRYDPILIRVTSAGELIWEKTFKSRLWDIDTTDGEVDVIDCKQDVAGNMYICGDIRLGGLSRAAMALKMDLTGNIIWNKGYAIGDFPKLTGIDVSANKITFAGSAVNGYYNAVINMGIVVNPSTGDTLLTTGFQSSTNDFWHTFYGDNMVKLKNRNLALYGRGASDGATFDSTELPTHGGMIEFTPDLQVVQSYILKSAVISNVYNTVLTVFEDGSAAYSWLNYFSGYNTDVIYGSISNNQVLKERVITYRGFSSAWISNFLEMSDGGQIVTNEIGDSLANVTYIEFMKLHNSDTSGSCLGHDTSGTIAEKQYYYNTNIYMDSVENNVLTENQRPFDGIYNDNFIIGSNCKQVSFCDSLKLIASPDTICENVPVEILVRKNKECGATPLWSYDTTVINSFSRLNDSTVQVTFDKPYQGYIAASIQGCRVLQDSVKFTVLQAPSGLDLGPDTSICPGNTILLNAKSGYLSYKWQDGSADSVFTVTGPGTYYVNTRDACGGSFSDTVAVSAHTSTPFSVGNDTSICKNDSITLAAPAGFMHYQWAANKILFDSLPTVNVSPLINTLYKVTVEESMGCFASDSINITVKNVPGIHLGNDTSLCSNQSLVLNAGNGFDTYQWNTGSASPQITVSMKGVYSVQASVSGCSAYDTLQILQVNPLPSFSLGNDTALCQGQLLHYSFSLPQAIYEWSTGSTLSYENISKAGTYSLQVTQAGCSGSDTINVIYNPSPIVNLGNDTTLCENQTLLLQAFNNNATYQWQDGSTAPTYLVKNEGTFFVTAGINNCTASDTISVLYKKLPYFTLGKDTFVCAGAPYVLTPFINTNASLLWQDGSTAASYTIQKEGIYFLTATNECGSYTDSLNITTGICNLLMPSGFTPNGDGINDVFKVKYPFPEKDFHFVMYDRWGEKVFETNDINKGWDGNYKGQPAIQNAYIWVINYIDINNKPQQLKGTVMLLR